MKTYPRITPLFSRILFKRPLLNTALMLSAFGLLGCEQQAQQTTITLTGAVHERAPLAQAEVHITNHRGQRWTTTTDSQGIYRITLPADTNLPLTVTAVSEPGRLDDCIRNDVLRPVCLTSALTEQPKNNEWIVNLNPLADRLSSDFAKAFNIQGPQQLFDANATYVVSADTANEAFIALKNAFGDAAKQLGVVTDSDFHPVTSRVVFEGKLNEILSLINHNRTYDNNSGLTGHTTLSDASFKPIVGLFHGGSSEPFDLDASRQQAKKIHSANTRIFFIGDSTSAMYEALRQPRMGWGEAFFEKFAALDDVAIVVGSRAGRSSRDFYNGRWFAQMEPLIQAGDYVFINHGHNDQNCDAAKPIRGAADVKNLCTYPNTADGTLQHPDGAEQLSFDNSIMRYVNIAKAKGAHAIIFTPTTRILDKDRKQQLPVVEGHSTRPHAEKDYAFTGNYAETLRQIAQREKLPLIDLERASITFSNTLNGTEWWNYWLVVDPSVNAYYANDMAGSPTAPDGTHFQARGAHIMADLVLEMISQKPRLQDLKNRLIK